MSDQATLGAIPNTTTSLPQPGVAASLIASDTLTAAFQNTISTVVSVEQARTVTLLVKYTPHASTSNAFVNLLVAFAYTRTAPATGDDSWFIGTTQVAGTALALPGTIPTGADFAASPVFVPRDSGHHFYRLAEVDASQPMRVAIDVPCAAARWMYVACSQSVDVTNFGTVVVDYVLSV